jgi:hypothetical protein
MRRALFGLALLVLAAASALAVDALAGEPLLPNLARTKPAIALAKPVLPLQHLYLIRSTLSALNDANRSGNYSVLRDLAAPSFQARYSPADLALIFADARTQPLDLAAAATTEPRLTEAIRADPQTLRLAGSLPVHPSPIAFTLHFEAVGGHWRVAAIGLGRGEAQPARAVIAVQK